MKKFYLSVVVALFLAILPSKENLAQTVCPAGPQKVFRVVGYNAVGQKVNMVYIEGFIPNAHISLFQNQHILSQYGGSTDANGNGTIVFDPLATNPDQVGTCALAGCCTQPIPAVVNCAALVQNVRYPASGSIPQICCIYISNSVANGDVRVFDANQNLIPTASSTAANTNIDGYTCYVYDCSKTPMSITVCGATGCCSQPIPPQATLPVKLTAFTANLTNTKQAELHWTSTMEIGADKFIVERSSDGSHFSGLTEVKSAGNTTFTRNYNFTDAGFSGLAFYRLKMVDIDGKFEYSKVVYVNDRAGSGIVSRIFPNPFLSEIQLIGINSADLNNKNIQVYNAAGKQVGYKITGANAISLDANAAPGIYILAVKEQRFKIIKQ